MPAAPKPNDEDERLAAVVASGPLDCRINPRLQVLTELAAELLERPNAGFSIIEGERLLFRAKHGLTSRGLPRDGSLCAHAILTPEHPLIVGDARLDARFADSPLVTGQFGLRSYAGVAVRSLGGQPIGALCVFDQEPGCFTAHQVDLLWSLARKVEDVIKLSRPAAVERATLLQELRQAILGSTLSLVWQPLADACSLEVEDYEALVRWSRGHRRDGEPGSLYPARRGVHSDLQDRPPRLGDGVQAGGGGRIAKTASQSTSRRDGSILLGRP